MRPTVPPRIRRIPPHLVIPVAGAIPLLSFVTRAQRFWIDACCLRMRCPVRSADGPPHVTTGDYAARVVCNTVTDSMWGVPGCMSYGVVRAT